ncbi:hypothetical protein [Klebsiella oxytoca]|uniref:hypothetical protein n=1 Tax=Klebsiella oxytoca TaxID=571 RepID=UPI001CCA108B|nr:hypothetical protein [Klebsiella oxytoca]MBZ7479910.1 hypothetical protein [Klebsiella oxytoca]MDM4091622.1 hypothetical protein [Klebsiella oxytoca]
MSTQKFYQLVDIPDYRFRSDESKISGIDFDAIATDCDTKTISLLEAIARIGLTVLTLSNEDSTDKDELSSLCAVISDLAELAIATNKIAKSAAYSTGYKDGENA